MANVLGTGPVAITSAGGAHMTIPLSALSVDTHGQIAISASAWPPASDSTIHDQAVAWASYLYNAGDLTADTTGAPAALPPAFDVVAKYPGKTGKSVTIDISSVTKKEPPNKSEMILKVTVVNVYAGLTKDSIAAIMGHNGPPAVVEGTEPGIVLLDSAAPPTMPVTTAGIAATGAPLMFSVPGTVMGTPAFLLEPRADTAGVASYTVDVTATGATTFDVTVTWVKTAPKQTLDLHATAFASVITITPPPDGYAAPANNSQVILNNGTDTTTAPPTPAHDTVPSA